MGFMTMRRFDKIDPAAFDDAQRELYDAILDGRRASESASPSLVDEHGRLEGPFNVFLLQPSLGQALQSVGATLRYGTSLPARARELAILVVAASLDAPFERHVHEPLARALGLTDSDITAVSRGEHSVLAPSDALVADACREMLQTHDLTDETYSNLAAAIGESQVFELTTLVGYYSLLALQLRAFRVPTADGEPSRSH